MSLASSPRHRESITVAVQKHGQSNAAHGALTADATTDVKMGAPLSDRPHRFASQARRLRNRERLTSECGPARRSVRIGRCG